LKLTQITQPDFGPATSVVLQMAVPTYDPYVFLQQQRSGGLLVNTFAIEEARNDIQQLAQLTQNWDGFGAIPIQEGTRNNAIAAVSSLLLWTPSPEISPNPNGTISLEWETDSGIAQLEVGQSKYSFFIDLRRGEPVLRDGSADQITFDVGMMVAAFLFPPPPGASAQTTIESDVQPSRRSLTR